MRAKLVNEKFIEDSDPVKDMGIGYKKRVLQSMTWKVLDFIKSKGEEGASLTEIQHYIWTELEGHSEESFWQKDWSNIRKTRGHWNTQLFGGMHYHDGVLHRFCKKNTQNKKWVFVKYPEPNENLYNWPRS